MSERISQRDWEALSAYIDGELSPHDRARLEKRIRASAGLRAALDDLWRTRLLMRNQPRLRAPRNFTLTPEMAGLRPKFESRAMNLFPVFRLTAAVASVLFVLVLLGDLLVAAPQQGAYLPIAAERVAQTVEVESIPEVDEAAGEPEMMMEAPEAPMEKAVVGTETEIEQPAEESLSQMAPGETEFTPRAGSGLPPTAPEATKITSEGEAVGTPPAVAPSPLLGTPTPAPQATLALEMEQAIEATPEGEATRQEEVARQTQSFLTEPVLWRVIEGVLILVVLVSGLTAILLRRMGRT